MRTFSNIAAAAAIVSIASAGDAPVVMNNPMGVTYSATIPTTNATTLSGAFKAAAAPDGEGVDIQIALYNLPTGGNLTYGVHTGNVASGGDCSNTGGILNPFGGITGAKCFTDKAACEAGDLSDKYGPVTITSGGSGTGYFSATYIDKYLSLQPKDQAYIGKGSIVVMDASGGYVACANFVNAMDAAPSSKEAAAAATKTTAHTSSGAKATGKGSNGSSGGSNSGSSSTSSGFAVRTAAPIVGAGILGLAALVF